MVSSEAEQSQNIMCMHTRFNMQEMDVAMGKDTVYVNMLRDPVDVFESQWQFYGLHSHYGMTIGKLFRLSRLSTNFKPVLFRKPLITTTQTSHLEQVLTQTQHLTKPLP